MSLITLLLLILLGVVLLLIEFLLIPGITVAGIGGFVCLAVGTYLSFIHFGTMAGVITLLSILIFIPVLLYLIFKSKASRSVMLETEIDGKVVLSEEGDFNIGDSGETLSRLTPLGQEKFIGNYNNRQTPV